jgi:hypothetical protein
MILSGAILFFCWLLSLGCIGAGWVLAYRLAPEPRRSEHLRWLVGWFIKGLLTPFLLWALMNLGLSFSLPAFMPSIQAAQNSGRGWFLQFLAVAAVGLYFISSYWAATTTGWALVRSHAWMEPQPRADFKALCRAWGIGMSLPALGFFWLGGWWTLGLAVLVVLIPIAVSTPTILIPRTLPPMYARAIARMKFGKYNEAELEIIRELEKREDDFEGWLMLADLYANHFHDLVEAEQTILEICSHPKTMPPQLSIALHKLADWHLKVGGNPEAARRALQMICNRLPGSHLARMAQLRLQQLPATREALRETQTNKSIPLPALGDHFDDTPAVPPSPAARAEAATKARTCVERLNQNPNDLSTREQLARLLAEQLGQPDQGIEQLLLLLNLPDQEAEKRAQWWSLVAAWHLKYRHDTAAGRSTLERILREFPQSPQALAARRRLQLMDAPQER